MFTTRPPRPPVVARFVSSYWYCELDVDHDAEVVFPSASGQIVIGLHPTSTEAVPIDATQQRRAVDVNLRVGSASFLCRENAKNLVDYEVDLDTYLRCRLDVGRQLNPDVIAAEEAIRLGVPAGRVPKLLRADRRRLACSFTETVELSLKSYGRICRFGAAVSDLRQPSAESLSTFAASLGYAEQVHSPERLTNSAA